MVAIIATTLAAIARRTNRVLHFNLRVALMDVRPVKMASW